MSPKTSTTLPQGHVDEDRRRAIDASNARWRGIFFVLGIVVPLLLGAAFARQQRRLDELVANGQPTIATVTNISDQEGHEVRYAYLVGDKTYDWSARRHEVVGEVELGGPLTITYSPATPSFSRVGFPFDAARREAERKPAITWGFPAGFALFFLGASALCHLALVRSRRGLPPPQRAIARRSPREQTELVLRFVTPLVFLIVLGTTQMADSLAVFRALWGDDPLGLPLRLVVAAGVSVLYAPLFFAARHVAPFFSPGDDELDLLVHLVKAPSHHRRSRRVVVATIVYLVVLFASWIAYTSHRGV